MKTHRTKRYALVLFTLISLVILTIATYVYNSSGHSIIKALYDCKSIKVLNRHANHPISHYYTKSDKIFNQITGWVLAVVVVVNLAVWSIRRRIAGALVVNVVTVLVFMEVFIAFEMAFPRMPKFSLDKFFQNLYIKSCRNIIQLEPLCARYDPDLTYTLRPGVFTFANREFSDEFRVNSLGVRDDERSLVRPQVVVLGDSYAMGWGVAQDQTYAALIENESGIKVLNAAIASYGTVREMRMLDRIDTSSLEYLIIHYYVNDYEENLTYFTNRNKLTISSRAEYEDTIKYYKEGKRYYPGKYLLFAYDTISMGVEHYVSGERPESEEDPAVEATVFLNAVIHAGTADLSGVKIIIVGTTDFIDRLKMAISSRSYPAYIEQMSFVAMPERSDKKSYYILDEHLTAKGHRILADALTELFR